jgi:hypothetical protein
MPAPARRRADAHDRVLRLHAATFVLVVALGAASMLANPALLRLPDAPLRDGGWARAYQANLDAASPLRPPTVAMWNALDLHVFGQAPGGVVLGEDGWLFSEEEYALPADPQSVRNQWIDLIASVAMRLDRDGVQLLVVLVPTKASLVEVGQPPLPAPAARRYDDALGRLRARVSRRSTCGPRSRSWASTPGSAPTPTGHLRARRRSRPPSPNGSGRSTPASPETARPRWRRAATRSSRVTWCGCSSSAPSDPTWDPHRR